MDTPDVSNGPIQIRPVKGNVIIEVMGYPARTLSGLHIPEIAQKELKRGRVVAVGHGTIYTTGARHPPDGKIGDIVLYGAKWQGDRFERDGRRFLVLEPEQTIAVIAAEDVESEQLTRLADADYYLDGRSRGRRVAPAVL